MTTSTANQTLFDLSSLDDTHRLEFLEQFFCFVPVFRITQDVFRVEYDFEIAEWQKTLDDMLPYLLEIQRSITFWRPFGGRFDHIRVGLPILEKATESGARQADYGRPTALISEVARQRFREVAPQSIDLACNDIPVAGLYLRLQVGDSVFGVLNYDHVGMAEFRWWTLNGLPSIAIDTKSEAVRAIVRFFVEKYDVEEIVCFQSSTGHLEYLPAQKFI